MMKRSWLEPSLYVLVVLAAFAGAIAAVVWGAPVIPSTPGLAENAVKRAEEIGRNRTAVLALLAGFIAVIGAVYTARNYQLARRGQTTDRFFKAVENLDTAKSVAVRIGSIYALEALAVEAPRESNAVQNVLQAFVDSHADTGNENDPDAQAASRVVERLTPSPTPPPVRRLALITAVSLVGAVAATISTLITDGGAERSGPSAPLVALTLAAAAVTVGIPALVGIIRRLRDPGPQPLNGQWYEVTLRGATPEVTLFDVDVDAGERPSGSPLTDDPTGDPR